MLRYFLRKRRSYTSATPAHMTPWPPIFYKVVALCMIGLEK